MSTTTNTERMPPGIAYIVANEFAERFCYYGINAILTVYMVQHLHFGQAQATVWQSLFKFGAYFFPIIGAILSDVFWGKFRVIIVLSLVYCAGCTLLALSSGATGLAAGLLLIALGTGGIKPCVSTNVGDQFTKKNAHLIQRAFSYFYISINAGSTFSIILCPILLAVSGPRLAFGVPAVMMFLATLVFWLGRKRFVVVPPAMTRDAGRGLALFLAAVVPVFAISLWLFKTVNPEYAPAVLVLALVAQLAALVWLGLKTPLARRLPSELHAWLAQSFTGENLKLVLRLAFIYYVFVAIFWSLWEQSNGQTWTLQATSDLMDKHLFGFLAGVPGLGALAQLQLLPAQIQFVNAVFIILLVPVFQFGIYPLWGRFARVTPLRKINAGLFVIAASYLIVAWIENRIMHGHRVSIWWQILAFLVLTAAEVLISITALEFAYSQAPLAMKSFLMAAMYLFAVAFGNAYTAQVNSQMVKPLHATDITAGAQTWVGLEDVSGLQTGQKIDLGGDTGLSLRDEAGHTIPLEGTFLVAQIDRAGRRVRLADAVHGRDVATIGAFRRGSATVSTYRLVGPQYFLFFAAAAALAGVLFLFVSGFYRERSHVREDRAAASATESA
ncbi:MAG: MFS transporter [Nevskia sp.]|nr:MFS transporter [Nevskia sp.]